MVKKDKLWQIVWIIGIYLILIVILYLVVQYKIKFEDRDFSKYLYFYNCGDTLCTTSINQEVFINRIKCENDTCPYIKTIKGKLSILAYKTKQILYNYDDNKIINDKYKELTFLDDENISFKDNDNKYGIINIKNEIINEAQYDQIISYNEGYLTYIKNSKYGIKNIYNEEEININPTYDDIKYISNRMFGAKTNGSYKIYNYKEELVNEKEYNYLFSYNEFIFVFDNEKFDILDTDFESKLIMKIKTRNDYKTEDAIKTLDIGVEEGIISFVVKTTSGDNKYYFDTEKGIIINSN